MKTVILDTDFILNSVKNSIELNSSIKSLLPYNVEIKIIDKTLEELKNKPLEKIARNLIKNFEIIKTKKNKPVDSLILDILKENNKTIVATQDKKLKEKLKKGKIQIITIRQQRYLVLL